MAITPASSTTPSRNRRRRSPRSSARGSRGASAASTAKIALLVSSPEGPLEIRSHKGKTRQIVLNLMANAIKFTDVGSVELSTALVGGGVELRVRDTGPGIAPDRVERIFEAFVQVDQSSTRVKGRTGLGLTVCRSLARLLGGHVGVAESTPGVGSTFALWLPARLDPPPEPELQVVPA